MRFTRVVRIIPLLGITLIAACSDVPTAPQRADEALPHYENGGSYGSDGRAQSDSTTSAIADAMEGANGGSYGSGG